MRYGRLEEPVVVGPRVHGQRIDQTDVRAFRRFDRAYAAVVRRMHVAHFEPGPLAGQAAWAKGRHAALVGNLGQRIVLVHELAQLGRAEELLDRRRHGLGIDQFLRRQAFAFGHGQALAHGALDPDQTDPEHVFGHLAHTAHPAVAQVVDVVDAAFAVADIDQHAQYIQDVLAIQHTGTFDFLAPDPTIELHAPDARKIVALFSEEQVLEQVLGGVLGRRLARAHHPVNFDQRFQFVAGRIDIQRAGNVRSLVQVVEVEQIEFLDARIAQCFQQFLGHLRVGRGQHFAGLLVDDRVGDHAAHQVFIGNIERGYARLPRSSSRGAP